MMSSSVTKIQELEKRIEILEKALRQRLDDEEEPEAVVKKPKKKILNLIGKAEREQRFDIVNFLTKHLNYSNADNLCTLALARGECKIYLWLLKNDYVIDDKTVYAAVRKYDLQFLKDHVFDKIDFEVNEIDEQRLFTECAKNDEENSLEIFKYLMSQFPKTVPEWKIISEIAAEHYNCSLIKFIISEAAGTESLSPNVKEIALISGACDVLKLLSEKGF